MKYNYIVGGITISTDIYYSELITSTTPADVILIYGNVPDSLDNAIKINSTVQLNKTQLLINISNIGKYLIENGNMITIQLNPNGLSGDLEKYLLVMPFACLCHQRGALPMLGGVICVNGKGVLITGQSYVGKSTLMALVNEKGYKIISDDITILQIIDNKVMAMPFIPRIKHRLNTIKILNLDINEGIKTRSDIDKYHFDLDEKDFIKPIELTKIIELRNIPSIDSIEPIRASKKIALLYRNDFYPEIAKHIWDKQNYVQIVTAVANKITATNYYSDKTKSLPIKTEEFIKILIS